MVEDTIRHIHRSHAPENLRSKIHDFVLYQLAYHTEFVKNVFGVGRIQHFIRQVLTSPVFVMFAVPPESLFIKFINKPLVSTPYLFPVIAVSQGQLRARVFFQRRFRHGQSGGYDRV